MRYIRTLLCAALLLALCLAAAPGAAADTTIATSGAGNFSVEQVYVNVPEMDVYFYATDANGESYTPTVVQAAGLELKLGDRKLDTSTIGQATGPVCYVVALDNSTEISPEDFRRMRAAVWQLIYHKNENDQIALYTLAGDVACAQTATSDPIALYNALARIRQQEGAMDLTGAASRVVSDIQHDYQALAPRKAVFLCTDVPRLITSPALLLGLFGEAGSTLNLAMYSFVASAAPETLQVLSTLSDGRVVPCAVEEMGDEMLAMQAHFATALELRTEVPESLYGERQEIVTLSVPSLGSAVQSSTVVYMGFKMEKPQVTQVEVLRRNTLRLTMNQAINANATRPQFYRVETNDIWNWRVPVKKVEIGEDGRTVTLTTGDLYEGDYHVSLNKVASRISPANVSTLRQQTDFHIAAWPRDNGFYLARFRVPLLVAAVVLGGLALHGLRLRRHDRLAEKEAEAEHLLTGTESDTALPRRWVTLFWGQRSSIAESRWAGMVESSLLLGSDAAQCDLCLPDSRIRPQHCMLCVRGEFLYVQTLTAEAAVFVNGERIDGEHRLQNNDTLRLGRTTLRLVL